MKCDELKSFNCVDSDLQEFCEPRLVYLKSEADKVIADKDKEIAELKKEKEYVIEHTAEVINGQERELSRQKYKRCLAMALLALEKRESYRAEYEEWCLKWYKRWLKIAEKFKEAK